MAEDARVLECNGDTIALDQPRIMGIVNITPDSFSDGGEFFDRERALAHAHALVEEGADIIDIGGESTRPGATPVSARDELARVMPVIEALVGAVDVPISIDTSKPEVMEAAAAAGVGLINDVYALRAPGALAAAARTGLPVCLMHMQGEPRTMQKHPHYDDVVADVGAFLRERAAAAEAAGVAREAIVLDPGFGFGKNTQHNYRLLARLDALDALGYPLLIGLSRKAMIRAVVAEAAQRTMASATAAALAASAGAAIVRVHDVAATRAALKIAHAVREPARL